MCGCRKPIEDWRSKISQDLQIPGGNILAIDTNTYSAKVSQTYVDYIKSGKYDFHTSQNIQSSMTPQDLQNQDSVPMNEVLITVLPIAECQSNIADGNGTTRCMYSQSFAAALDMVTDTNQNEISKGVIRSNLNSYNSMQVFVSNSTDRLPNRESCQNLLEKMFEGCVICHQQRKWNSDGQVPVLFEKSVRNESKDGSRLQDLSHESIEECSGRRKENKPKKLGTDFLDSKGSMTGDSIMAKATHVNMRKPISIFVTERVIYIVNLLPIYTVHHALMYSPALLPSDKIKTLFVFYQLLQFMSTFGDKFLRDMGGLRWDDIAFDSHGWINVFLSASSYLAFESNVSTLENEENNKPVMKNYQIDLQRLPELLDKWICCELSTFDYLMFLNKLAGRSEEDPNHHPILPWISTLESENGSWRDLTKSKYRLNKGDRQLDLQYTMMGESAQMKDEKSLPNLRQVPHHVPEFLSDIAYYVYTARRTSKDVLCKLVRSYWEPNEYPASIQRMQAWTPDECIPEFYTDPGVFISMHNDMADLAVPDWCSDAADFISKHRCMLESDEVSLSLHHWIDVTFGYKLSGQDSVEAKNVCFPLVDNHDTLTKRGITQLFDVPHPRRRYCKKTPTGLGNPEIDGGDLQLPASYNPREELEELEKLLVFKTKVCNNADMSRSLVESLAQCCDKITSDLQKQTFLSDRNVVVLLCLMIELYLPLQTRTIANDLPLGERFKCCLHCFKVYKSRLPCGIRFAMEYFIRNLRRSERETIEQLLAGVEECRSSYCSIFKTVSDKGLPTPTPTLLCSQYIHIFPFPPYFKDLYDVLELVLRLTDNYSKPLPYSDLDCVTQKIHGLFEKLDETEDCLEIFIPHIQQLLKQKTDNAAEFLLANFEAISKGMGIKASLEVLSPLILQIYNDSHEVDTAGKSLAPLVGLYQRTFLLQLSTRLGLNAFLQNIPSCLADALMMDFNSEIPETSQQSICWLMERIGPTLTSKYIVRHLFRVLTQCFILENGSPVVEFESYHVKAVLDCLIHAAELYGTSIITLQYFAHLIHSILSAVGHPKYAPRHQAAVEASVSAVTFFISYLTDAVLMEQLTRISKDMVVPVVELLGRSDLSFYGGAEARKSLCLKIIHLMALIVIRIGREMSREHLTPLFLSFFSHYHPSTQVSSSAPQSIKKLDATFDSVDEDAVIIDHDLDTRTFKVGSTILVQGTTGLRKQLHKSWFVDSPTPSPNKSQQISTSMDSGGSTHPEQEIAATFCAETAYCSYVSFTRLLGDIHMERILGMNHDHIWKLSLEHEKILGEKNELMSHPSLIHSSSPSDITMIGNRLIVESQMSEPDMKPVNEDDPDIMATLLTSVGGYRTEDQLGSSIRRNLKVSSSSQQLTENWLAYWEHEIGLPENDRHIHFNQIELQGFAGHNGAVRCVSAHPSEEWFVSGGKDKTVKIWSLCNDGENRTKLQRNALAPSHSYNSHKKAVTCIGIVESEQLVVSNDGNLHAWDPYTCQQVLIYDSSDVKTGFALLATLPSPQRYALAITNDADLRFIDFRKKCLAHEFKTIVGNSIGIPRAMCASSDSNRVAVGFSTGMVSTIDIRAGTVLSMKPAHEADISTMAVMSEKRYVTASADQTVAVWEFDRSSPITVFRSFQEPVHTVQKFNDEIISASLAGRVLVHSLPGPFGLKCAADQPVAVSKLRSDSLKGNLMAFCVLPMKRQILLASDSGNIKLMA